MSYARGVRPPLQKEAFRMAHQYSSLTFTPHVAEVQREMGTRAANEKLTERGPANDRFGEQERDHIQARDGFYIATVGETGWPYIQFRGDPPGFLRVLDNRTMAYADITGNRQYITTGNLRTNDRVALFLMDYPNQARLKVLGHVEIVPWNEAGAWREQLPIADKGRPERAVRIHLAAFDWNCPQHIPQRWTIQELQQSPVWERVRGLQEEVRGLEQQVHGLEQDALSCVRRSRRPGARRRRGAECGGRQFEM